MAAIPSLDRSLVSHRSLDRSLEAWARSLGTLNLERPGRRRRRPDVCRACPRMSMRECEDERRADRGHKDAS
eukprot:9025848-Pyramimonas_sp.AAC.1